MGSVAGSASVTMASGSSTTPTLDARVRCSRSASHFGNDTTQGTSRPETGTSISRAQAPLNLALQDPLGGPDEQRHQRCDHQQDEYQCAGHVPMAVSYS